MNLFTKFHSNKSENSSHYAPDRYPPTKFTQSKLKLIHHTLLPHLMQRATVSLKSCVESSSRASLACSCSRLAASAIAMDLARSRRV